MTAFNTDLLESDLVVSPPTNVTELLDCYNTTLKQLVDRHVPVVTVTSYSRPTAPWYCDSGLDSIESPGILIIIDGPEHDGLSQVYSHLSSYHVGSHVPAYP